VYSVTIFSHFPIPFSHFPTWCMTPGPFAFLRCVDPPEREKKLPHLARFSVRLMQEAFLGITGRKG
jgi:hypothetical protein